MVRIHLRDPVIGRKGALALDVNACHHLVVAREYGCPRRPIGRVAQMREE
jgi:hypothetical protein